MKYEELQSFQTNNCRKKSIGISLIIQTGHTPAENLCEGELILLVDAG